MANTDQIVQIVKWLGDAIGESADLFDGFAPEVMEIGRAHV